MRSFHTALAGVSFSHCMDASAYLRSHGWRGHGHSLDTTNRGITKPLLISKKVDVLGVGLNKHKAVSDQWWLRAFDQGLKSLGTGEETALSQVQKHGVNRGGLYANFVKGERFEGSIGNSVLPTPEESEDAVDKQPDEDRNTAVAKLSTKRKRETERPAEKRARRKTERQETTRAHTLENRAEEKSTAIEDGTYNAEAEAEKVAKREHTRDINRQAGELILDAQRRGIIPHGPNEIRKGLIPTGANATIVSEPSEDLVAVLNSSGIDPANPVKVSGSVKAQKYARMKLQREIKRVAKAYLMGESLLPLPSTKEERKQLKEKRKKMDQPTSLERAQKRAERTRVVAEKTAADEEKTRKQKAARERKREEREVVDQIIAERAAQNSNDGQLVKQPTAVDPCAFDNEADEIKLGLSAKGTLKKVPRVGVVDQYPSKGEKRAKRLEAAAIKAEIDDDEMQARIRQNRIARYDLDMPKLEQYLERASEKGMTLDEYVKRREQKKNEKDSAKGNANVMEIWGDGEVIVDDSALATKANDGTLDEDDATDDDDSENDDSHNDDNSSDGGLGFVVDTTGDSRLEFKVTSTKEAYETNPKPLEVLSDMRAAQLSGIPITSIPTLNPKISNPTNLATKAMIAISENRPFTVVDKEGNPSLQWQPGQTIPPDPRIWEGVVVNELPRKIREARKTWMKLKREEKNRLLEPNDRKTKAKARGARKIEAREKFLHTILHASREALKTNGVWGGFADIAGRQNVPLVKVESMEGKFSKLETSLARTVARRTQRDDKRAERAEQGKGKCKGWKKRERAEKQVRIEQGISRYVDRKRNG